MKKGNDPSSSLTATAHWASSLPHDDHFIAFLSQMTDLRVVTIILTTSSQLCYRDFYILNEKRNMFL